MPTLTKDYGWGAPPVDEATAVRAKPVVIARWSVVVAVAVLVLFVAIALVMTGSESAGAPFTSSDQLATGLIGLLAAAGILLLGRPRLVADRHGLRTKAWAGRYRYIPWDVVVDIRFLASARFARVILPGEEYLSLYAVHRWDGERAVAVMDALRTLQQRVRADRATSAQRAATE